MQAYSFRLYLEYARLVHPDRDSGDMVRRLHLHRHDTVHSTSPRLTSSRIPLLQDYKPGSRLPPAGSSPQQPPGEEKKKKLTGIGKVEPVKEKPAPVIDETAEHEQDIRRRSRRTTTVKPDTR